MGVLSREGCWSLPVGDILTLLVNIIKRKLPVMKISEKLKTVVEASGLKKKEIAEASGISQVALSKYLGGVVTPKQENLSKIAKALGVDLGYFYSDGDEVILSADELEHWKRRALDAEGKLLALRDVWPSINRTYSLLRQSFANNFSREDINDVAMETQILSDKDLLAAAEELDDDRGNPWGEE